MEPMSDVQIRVLGSLLEKQATVPDSYPLTMNALRTACNQATNRDPVMQLTTRDLEVTLLNLKTKGYVRFVHPASGERATRYRQSLDEVLGLDEADKAALGVLMLRGPQTMASLRSRTERYEVPGGFAAVEEALDALARRDDPLVVWLPAQPGQKEGRVAHLLGGPIDVEALAAAAAGSGGRSGAGARADELHAEVAELRSLVEHLYEQLGVERPRGPGVGEAPEADEGQH